MASATDQLLHRAIRVVADRIHDRGASFGCHIGVGHRRIRFVPTPLASKDLLFEAGARKVYASDYNHALQYVCSGEVRGDWNRKEDVHSYDHLSFVVWLNPLGKGATGRERGMREQVWRTAKSVDEVGTLKPGWVRLFERQILPIDLLDADSSEGLNALASQVDRTATELGAWASRVAEALRRDGVVRSGRM